ncbi:MAG: aminopeptidase P family N-terminal domain-containing protein, partial [Pseudomonadota bacterium]
MFQSYDQPDLGEAGPERLAAIRGAIAAAGFDGFLIPRADVHQGEYVPPADERLAWATGFTGSAGAAAVLADRAAVFVDGRYTLQAQRQVDRSIYEIDEWREGRFGDWLAEAAAKGARIAYDPWLHGKAEVEALSKKLDRAGASLLAAEANLIDEVWEDRPPSPAAAIRPHPLELAGESAADKRARIGEAAAALGADWALLTLPDSIAWLLNIRGADIPRNPVPLSFALLRSDGAARLFLRPGQADGTLAAHLGPDVAIEARADFGAALSALEGAVLLDRRSCPIAAATAIEAGGARVVW